VAGDHGVDRGGHGSGIGYIEHRRLPANPGGHLGRRPVGEVVDDHPGTVGGQTLGDGCAQAGSGAGDQDHSISHDGAG